MYKVSFPDLGGQNKFPIQLSMRGMSVENYNLYSLAQQQQQALPRKQTNSQDELNFQEIGELCDFFSRRVVSEPYDASKIASFVTLLLLPISVLREFLKLIAWKQGIAQAQSADTAPSERPRVELCLDSHLRSNSSDKAASALSKSNIRYDRPHNAVDFELIVFLDPAYFSCVNAASGASGLPQCVSLRLKYAFGENPHVSLLSMEGSHRGCASWLCTEDWEHCKQRVVKAVEIAGRGSGVCGSSMDVCQGRLRAVAETLQHYFQSPLLQL